MVDFTDPVFSISTQAEMLSLNRTSLYYKPRPSSEWDLQLNRLIDITYTKHPEFGYRRITAWLDRYYGFHVDKKTVLSECRKWGYKPFTPGKTPVKRTLPIKYIPIFSMGYRLPFRIMFGVFDSTYIPIQKSWLYLTAIIDWYSRYVLAWEIDDTLEIKFVLDTCQRHLAALYLKS